MLGSPILYFKGMRLTIFQLSSFYFRGKLQDVISCNAALAACTGDGGWLRAVSLLQAAWQCFLGLPIGPMVVPFWGSYLEFYKVIPKRNYYGAYVVYRA